MAAPRIALLVHSRLESDPRVSRHARAAAEAGFRVAALCVGVAGEGETARWGERSAEGFPVFESRVVRRTVLGRFRRQLARRGGAAAPRQQTDAAPQRGSAARAASGPAQAARDLFTIAMLLRNNTGVFRQFRGIGAGVVHANDLNVLPAGYLLARYWRVPLVYDSHELWTALDGEWSPFLRRLFALVEGALIRRADAVVTVNGAIAGELAARYTVGEPVVVMNCPDVPPAAAHAARAAMSAADQPLRVVYQGMLNANRGLEGLIDAVAATPGATLDIRGPGSLASILERRIHARSAADRITLLPPVPMHDLVAALVGYDVGVVPYLPVGMNNILCSPNKLFEYMAAGLAVACSDLPVLREVVEAADCGLLYEAGETDALARVLARLAVDRALLARLRTNALEATERRFNARHEEAKLLDIYRWLLGGRDRAAMPAPAGEVR